MASSRAKSTPPGKPGATLGKHDHSRDDASLLLDGLGVTRYCEIVGSLMYLVTCTRPDLAFPVIQLAKRTSVPMKEQNNMAQWKQYDGS